ncbi:MAG: uroporphyrinogen-III synthase, partial [Acidobacteriota bacterium]
MSAQAARPLAGRAVAVTRDEGADGALSRRLRERGAEVLTWPAVKIDPPDDPSPLEQAIAGIERFDWIVFTSVRAVEVVPERRHLPPERTRIAAVGTKTATALEKAGWGVALVPVGTGASSLVNAFARIGLRGALVLFPASS